jgi:SAM-dependent methyltransferase
MPILMLNISQTPEELARIHEADYYWYLRSTSFVDAFVRPLGDIINKIGLPCLDVGCGEGYLKDYASVPYFGIDGSSVAIAKAIEQRGDCFKVARFETPNEIPFPFHAFGTVVFGGIFHVLVKPEHRVELVKSYREQFGASRLVVYDLGILDTTELDAEFKPVHEYHASARGMPPGFEEIKAHRKIIVYDIAK